MTALIEIDPGRASDGPGSHVAAAVPTTDIAGVRWPVNKLHAVVAGIIVALVAVLLTGSGVTTMWVTAAVVLAVWWGESAWFALRAAAGRRRRHLAAR